MATLRKRGTSWEYIISAGKNPLTGKYDTISKAGFRTKTEAKEAARKIEQELKEGTYIKESKMKFGDFTDQWLSHYEKRAKISSVRARSIAAKKLRDEWEHHSISGITMSMYQRHLDSLSTTFSANYLDSIHSTGRMIFNHAMKLGLIKRNPTEHFEKPRMMIEEPLGEVEEIENFLEQDELTEFLLLAKNKGLRMDLLIFSTLAYSGIRIGELIALKESDVDISSNTISVSKTYYNPNNNKKEYTLLSPKTKGSIRKVEVDPFVISLFKLRLKELKEEKIKHHIAYHDEGFIFCDVQGYPMPIKLISTRLQRLMKYMNTSKHITPHSFRHTNISLLIEARIPIGEIQRRVGHSDINTTMNIYTHMTKNTKDQASSIFSSHMSAITKQLQ